LERRQRAFTTWPGAWFNYQGQRIKILAMEVTIGEGAPGEVLDDRLLIACGKGAVRLTRVQRAGKAPMTAEEFLRGFAVPKGAELL